MSEQDPIALLESLDVVDLVSRRDDFKKKVDALDVLITAAKKLRNVTVTNSQPIVVAGDGRKNKDGKIDACTESDGDDLRARIIRFLNQVQSARLTVVAAVLGVPLEDVQSIVCAPDFKHRGVGYWSVATE